MNQNTILMKFRKYFFVMIICLLIAIGYSFNLSQKSEFVASVSIGFSPKSSPIPTDSLKDKEYTLLLNGFTQYLQNRLSSLNIQDIFAKNLKISLTKNNEKKPIYDVIPTGLGFANISMTTNSQIDAQKFVETTKEVLNNKLIPEWNGERTSQYQVVTNNNIVSSINEIKTSQVNLLIPILIALVLGTSITLLLPLKK